MIRRRYDELKTYEEVNTFFTDILFKLADDNNVRINEISQEAIEDFYYKYGRPSAQDIFIIDGELFYCKDDFGFMNAELMIHELLHILSVPKRYRWMMSVDTEKSYRKIREVYDDRHKTMRESAVIGAQAILYSKCQCVGELHGSFFSGHIRRKSYNFGYITDVKKEWMTRGDLLLKTINFNF